MDEKDMGMTVCAVCLENEAEVVMMPHWKTGEMMPFHEATCSNPKCKKEYDEAMTAAELWMDCQRDYAYEG